MCVLAQTWHLWACVLLQRPAGVEGGVGVSRGHPEWRFGPGGFWQNDPPEAVSSTSGEGLRQPVTHPQGLGKPRRAAPPFPIQRMANWVGGLTSQVELRTAASGRLAAGTLGSDVRTSPLMWPALTSGAALIGTAVSVPRCSLTLLSFAVGRDKQHMACHS